MTEEQRKFGEELARRLIKRAESARNALSKKRICKVCGEESTGMLMDTTLDEVVLLCDDCNLNYRRGLNEEGEDE